MSNPTPGVLHAMQCTDTAPESCSTKGAGHALPQLQERVAAATPSRWRDAIVTHITDSGWLGLEIVDHTRDTQIGSTSTEAAPLDDATPETNRSVETVWVWNHAGFAASARLGEPVAVHGLYNTLAIGSTRVNVLVAGI